MDNKKEWLERIITFCFIALDVIEVMIKATALALFFYALAIILKNYTPIIIRLITEETLPYFP